jgi:hypothetical protein
MIYVYCWILSAVIGGMIGHSKGRAGVGAIWGLLLGPLGWFFAALDKDERTKCSECFGVIVPGARKCIHCGSLIGDSDEPEVHSHESALIDDWTWSQLLISIVLLFGAIVGGPLVFGWLSADHDSKPVRRTFDQIRAELDKSPPSLASSSYTPDKRVTMPQYNRLQNGMSYMTVSDALGSSGSETSHTHTDGIADVMGPVETVSYSWINSDGSNVSVMFQNDKLISKAQFGLR